MFRGVRSSPARAQLAVLAVSIALVAGCGGGSKSTNAPSPPTTTAAATAKARTPLVRALIRDYKTLGLDIGAMRTAAVKAHGPSLKGTPALRTTTGKFLEDLETSQLSPKAQNRMIDHAMGAVATSCDQCFQQLEANRPNVQIAHPH